MIKVDPAIAAPEVGDGDLSVPSSSDTWKRGTRRTVDYERPMNDPYAARSVFEPRLGGFAAAQRAQQAFSGKVGGVLARVAGFMSRRSTSS